MSAGQTLSIEQVNQRLPLVAVIVRDIVSLHVDILSRKSRLKTIHRRRRGSSGSVNVYEEEVHQMEAELIQDEQRLEGFTAELLAIGGHLTDPALGAVEFASELSGRDPVWLCWRPGDEFIQFWHAGSCGDSERIPLCHEAEGSPASSSSDIEEDAD